MRDAWLMLCVHYVIVLLFIYFASGGGGASLFFNVPILFLASPGRSLEVHCRDH